MVRPPIVPTALIRFIYATTPAGPGSGLAGHISGLASQGFRLLMRCALHVETGEVDRIETKLDELSLSLARSWAGVDQAIEDQRRLDRLAEADFVGEDAAPFGDTVQRKHDSVDLVRVGIDAAAPLSRSVTPPLRGAAQGEEPLAFELPSIEEPAPVEPVRATEAPRPRIYCSLALSRSSASEPPGVLRVVMHCSSNCGLSEKRK